MLAKIALEAFCYFDRTTLEKLQWHSRYLRDLVNRHARSLPLRYTHNVLVSKPTVYLSKILPRRASSIHAPIVDLGLTIRTLPPLTSVRKIVTRSVPVAPFPFETPPPVPFLGTGPAPVPFLDKFCL